MRGFALRTQIDHPICPSRFPGQNPIEARPTLSRNFRLKALTDLEL